MATKCGVMPDDSVEQIMSWVPPPSLVPFKCVSNSCYYYHLLRGPPFLLTLFDTEDGLICLVNGFGSVMLCNPALQEFRVVPPSEYADDFNKHMVGGIGFGYDSRCDDYKIVQISSHRAVADLYSLMEIWLLNEHFDDDNVNGSPWIKHLSIGPLVGIDRPLQFWKSDELLMLDADGRSVSFNLATQKLRSLPTHPADGIIYWGCYVKSLISVNGRNRV
ncbi:hypothetical protein TorRG33x02_006110 [Trema orientale]|uniref:F-box domain-containing protein n=1 Tax=Trema orientale TaxID=63057 RepID=A0A2P5G043_TREOI|nr:hypothetical protein TorRG33x02_006110 [Trema orientale]